jgi:hypothetical protein
MVVLVSQRQKPTSHAGEMFMETHQACDMMSFFFVFFGVVGARSCQTSNTVIMGTIQEDISWQRYVNSV